MALTQNDEFPKVVLGGVIFEIEIAGDELRDLALYAVSQKVSLREALWLLLDAAMITVRARDGL